MHQTSIVTPAGQTAAAGKGAAGTPMLLPSSDSTHGLLCAHCGQSCGSEAGRLSELKPSFCCVGCQTVFTLLNETGLGQFYELAPRPGTRIGKAATHEDWAYLDEPAVRLKLLDFEDERRAKVTFHLPAIHCVACVWLLENLFRLRPGVGESRVHFERREVQITFDPARLNLSDIAGLLASLGYEPALTLGELDSAAGKKSTGGRQRQREWLQVGLAGFAFGNIMLLALPGYLGLDSLSVSWFRSLAGGLSLALAAPVLVYSAADYWHAAWFSLKQRTLTLDVPIALGLAAIYGQSLFEILSGRGEGYCDSLTGLIFFLLCGRLFQRKTFERLAFDRDYKGFFPLAVTRKTNPSAGVPKEAGPENVTTEESVSISQLKVGDRLLIRHGELIAADARLVSEEALVDYSFVTGESEPVRRRAGDLLYAGGKQAGGAIEVETLKPVSESYLTSLWNSEAFRKQREEELLSQTNRYSRRFTVLVITVAFAAAIFWLFFNAGVALKAFTSVLIVACPCALALAAPLTLGTAQRLLAGRRTFLRNAQVVERMAEIDTVVFDKTGTLTSRNGPVRWRGEPLSRCESSAVHSLAAHSAHPLARRIQQALQANSAWAQVDKFAETPGSGMEGEAQGRRILMGSASWLDSRGVEFDGSSRSGCTSPETLWPTVHVAIGGRYRGCFQLESALRPEVESLIGALRGQYQLVLLSGDQPREAARFRMLLGKDARVLFNQNPFDKLEAIAELQSQGRKVMMVGDGLNDAGALRQSDVGVAVVENVGTFSPASDVILEAQQLSRLATVLTFAKRAAGVVRAGFVVSGLYNLAGISIAAAGWLSPLVCAVLMPLSSASVVLFTIGATRWTARQVLALEERR